MLLPMILHFGPLRGLKRRYATSIRAVTARLPVPIKTKSSWLHHEIKEQRGVPPRGVRP